MSRADEPSRAAAEWMQTARMRIGQMLLDLYEIHRLHAEHLKTQAELERIAGLLTGISLALWRSAFLIYWVDETEAKSRDIVEGQKEILLCLVRDNAVNYPQDRGARDWTSGFYVNCALDRVNKLNAELGRDAITTGAPPHTPEDHGRKDRLLWKDWDKIYDRSQEFVTLLGKRCTDLAGSSKSQDRL